MKIMSIIIKGTELFCDSLFKYFVELIEIIPSTFKLVILSGFAVVPCYALYRVYERQRKIDSCKSTDNFIDSEKIKEYNRLFIRHRSTLGHKDMLKKLEYAADVNELFTYGKCYQKEYALQCIDITVYCPHLLNVKSPLTGITPFHRVCFHGHTCLITFMLAKGADPFIATIAGENALCMAIYYFLTNPIEQNFSCLDILRQTGCTFGFENRWYNTLLQQAFTKKNLKLAHWIIVHSEIPSQNILRCSSMPLYNHNINY